VLKHIFKRIGNWKMYILIFDQIQNMMLGCEWLPRCCYVTIRLIILITAINLLHFV